MLRIPTVHHVGDMDPSSKRTDSYEGAGLSVCLHPSSWRRIARGCVGGTTHRLTHPEGAFVDAHALDGPSRTSILAWAVARGYAKPATIWTMSWDDCDENGKERRSHSVFAAAEDAACEAEEYEDQGVEVVETQQHRSTTILETLAMQTRPALGDRSVVDLVLPAWAHEVHGISGVWWNDEHDPYGLSAPRGVIRPGALCEWAVEPIGHDPDDEDVDDADEEDLDEDDALEQVAA
jgi:hypothetical protein